MTGLPAFIHIQTLTTAVLTVQAAMGAGSYV